MKHFIVMIHYTSPMDEIDKVRPSHRVFLQSGYDAGLLLMSGPQCPRSAGIAVARASDLAEIVAFFKNDPYQVNNLASYEFLEFEPVICQPLIKQWINPKESLRTIE